MNKSNLNCTICTKNQYCELLQDIKELKEKIKKEKEQLKELKTIQLSIAGNFNSSSKHEYIFHNLDKEMKELTKIENKQQKCFNSRSYVHTHIPKYIMFFDDKYDYQGDPQFLYFYCGKWKEYLLKYPDTNMEELDETM